jgi:hypothetical protein
MNAITEILEKNTIEINNINVMLHCGNLLLINDSFNMNEFEGGLNEFTKIVNRLTKPFQDAPVNKCLLTFEIDEDSDVISFEFIAGKFAPKFNTIIDSIVQKAFCTDKEKFKNTKKDFLNYINTQKMSFIELVEFIYKIEKSKLYELQPIFKNLHIKATNEALLLINNNTTNE